MSYVRWATIAALLLFDRAATAAEPGGDWLALEQAVQEAVQKTEQSIACVLVSRSTLYKPFDPPPSMNDVPGQLGDFNPEAAIAVARGNKFRERQIRALDLANPDNVPESYGSGVVIDSSGLVLTNAHVVAGATRVYVRVPGGGGSYADLHALDPRSDLAVLRLLNPPEDLKALKPGDGGKLRKGQFVIALANPFAAGSREGNPSASFGIVSNLRRRTPGYSSEVERNRLTLQQFGLLIETDARLNLGCSGGALVNLKGEWIGLTSARAALAGVETPGGFAIPIDEGVRRIIDVLRRGDEVEYGFLGIKFNTEIKDGVRVSEVIEKSPASLAGLKSGDYILSVDGVPIRHQDDVFVAVGARLAGSTVVVERSQQAGGQRDKVKVTLAKFYVPKPSLASRRSPAPAGLRVDDAAIAVQRPGFHARTGVPDGVIIREVVPGSPADRAKLQTDRIITHVNGKAVNAPAEFHTAMKAARGDIELQLSHPEGGPSKIMLRVD